MVKIRNPKDFWSGVIFMVLGLGALYIARGYTMGTAGRMGPGYFPTVLAIILTGLGLIILVLSLRTDGPKVDKFALRPLFVILLTVVVFGVIVKTLGMALSLVVLVFGSAFGGDEFKWKEVTILAVVLSLASVLVFVYGLRLPFPVWPTFITG